MITQTTTNLIREDDELQHVDDTSLFTVIRNNHLVEVDLLFGMTRVLEEWGKRGVDIIKVYANGGSIYGKRLLETAGFTKLDERRDNRFIYELDIATSDLQVLRPYKDAITEYKEKKL